MALLRRGLVAFPQKYGMFPENRKVERSSCVGFSLAEHDRARRRRLLACLLGAMPVAAPGVVANMKRLLDFVHDCLGETPGFRQFDERHHPN